MYFRRFFQENEEIAILTHSDELNRNYSDDARLPVDLTSTSSDEVPGTGPATDEQTSGSTGASRWDNRAFKQTTATIDSSGTRSLIVTSAVTTADSRRFHESWSLGRGRRSPPKKGRESSRPTRQLGVNMQELLEAEVEKTGRDEERKRMIPLNPIYDSSSITERPNPAATITAWEAAWNVTNAIQVPNITTQKKIIPQQTFTDAFF